MRTCYVLDNVPEAELENVKDSIEMDNCNAEIVETGDGVYQVKAICEND
jgi:hypothetical protein